MNCKPGDVAYIAKPSPHLAALLGRIVKLKNDAPIFPDGVPCWRIEGVVSAPLTHSVVQRGFYLPAGEVVSADYLPDAWLRSIRDPGDDAVDEMVLRVGRPDEVPA